MKLHSPHNLNVLDVFITISMIFPSTGTWDCGTPVRSGGRISAASICPSRSEMIMTKYLSIKVWNDYNQYPRYVLSSISYLSYGEGVKIIILTSYMMIPFLQWTLKWLKENGGKRIIRKIFAQLRGYDNICLLNANDADVFDFIQVKAFVAFSFLKSRNIIIVP